MEPAVVRYRTWLPQSSLIVFRFGKNCVMGYCNVQTDRQTSTHPHRLCSICQRASAHLFSPLIILSADGVGFVLRFASVLHRRGKGRKCAYSLSPFTSTLAVDECFSVGVWCMPVCMCVCLYVYVSRSFVIAHLA